MVLFTAGCSPKIYRPPALGAEYQFDRGLPPAKKPSHLFDPKAEKDLIEKGMLPGARSADRPRKAAVAAPKTTATPDSASKAAPPQKAAENTTLTPPKKQE